MLGFPCNQFGEQEPGDAEEIANFCKLTYDVDFPIYAKIDVNGDKAAPLYDYLKKRSAGPARVEEDQVELHQIPRRQAGKVVKRYAPQTKPEDMVRDIEALIAQPAAA